jgi:superfamily II DNA/RNA helicase
MTFDIFNLHPQILKALSAAGYTEPTGIQIKAIPKIMAGFDIRASAQTGTGKTGAFLIPVLNRLTAPSSKPGRGPRVLILVPTRELAMQVSGQAEKYSRFLPSVKSVCVVGGVPYTEQLRNLSKPHDILIATPGRLIDFIGRSKIDFSRLEMIVLDEADRMLDMGFVDPVEQIVARAPKERQTLLFSATLQGSVRSLSERLMNKPMDIVVHSDQEKNDNISQQLYYTDDIRHKNRLLEHILKMDGVDRTIVFTATKRHADELVDDLYDKGHRAAVLHGDMKQRQRTRTLAQLKNGEINVLVATDVASRGIDVQAVTHVINFDLPRSAEDYVHRIGRTGRAGSKGTALSFASRRDSFLVKKIEAFTGQQINALTIEGLEPSSKARPSSPYPKKSFGFQKKKPRPFNNTRKY